jgi:hypothetical protein
MIQLRAFLDLIAQGGRAALTPDYRWGVVAAVLWMIWVHFNIPDRYTGEQAMHAYLGAALLSVGIGGIANAIARRFFSG